MSSAVATEARGKFLVFLRNKYGDGYDGCPDYGPDYTVRMFRRGREGFAFDPVVAAFSNSAYDKCVLVVIRVERASGNAFDGYGVEDTAIYENVIFEEKRWSPANLAIWEKHFTDRVDILADAAASELGNRVAGAVGGVARAVGGMFTKPIRLAAPLDADADAGARRAAALLARLRAMEVVP